MDVRGVRLSGDGANTRLVVELSSPVSHTLFALENPPRIVLDLHGVRIDRDRLRMPAGQGPIVKLRSANRDNGDARIVMDLSSSTKARSFMVPPDGSHGHRMVIDLEGRTPAGSTVATKSVAGQGRDLVIAIDAGDGGKDPGAIGRRGTREKDVVLQIARRLAEKINAEPGMRAYLTRDGDYFLALRQRMDRARAQRADLFRDFGQECPQLLPVTADDLDDDARWRLGLFEEPLEAVRARQGAGEQQRQCEQQSQAFHGVYSSGPRRNFYS